MSKHVHGSTFGSFQKLLEVFGSQLPYVWMFLEVNFQEDLPGLEINFHVWKFNIVTSFLKESCRINFYIYTNKVYGSLGFYVHIHA